MFKQLFLVLCFFIIHAKSVEVNRSAEGFPSGYLSVCPGSDKPTSIPRSVLKSLHFVIEGKSKTGFYHRYYSYFNAVEGILSDRHIDFKRKTMVYVSGWLDTTTISPFPRIIGSSYVNLDYNVILIDTNRFTTFAYPIAARLSHEVGRRCGMIFAELIASGLNPKTTHLIGLSLGGQVISYIAKTVRNITGSTFGRITGLDPSGPCFRTLPPEDRLDITDADHVDIIHTNIDGFGIATPVGHVDFYFNGGENQPNDIEEIPCTSMCSHIRSYLYWISTLEYQHSLIGLKCNTVQEARDGDCYKNKPMVTNVVGPRTDFSKPGIYYVTTKGAFPYVMGESGLKEENEYWKSRSKMANRGDVKFN